MKLEQEQTKKLAISVTALVALLYGYFAFLLGPLKKGEKFATDGIALLEPEIASAKKQLVTTEDLEKKAPDATEFITNIKNGIPDGEPIAWFPPKIAQFFKSHGIEKCTTHLVSESPGNMPGFRKIVWSIDMPKVEFAPLGIAIASLENDEPLLDILNVSVDATRENAQYQHATLVLSTLVKS
jgi:hypothetical protein